MKSKLATYIKNNQALCLLLAAFTFIRLVLLAGSSYEGILGYGDLQTYFHLSNLPGWPYLNSWAEYPPLFPFITEWVYGLVGGNEYAFSYTLILMFLIADLANITLVHSLAGNTPGRQRKTLLFAVFLCVLPYTWWYFESLVVLLVLLSIYFLRTNRVYSGAITIAVGALLKLFPLLMVGLFFKKMSLSKFVRATAIVLLMVSAVYAALWTQSPDFTLASIASQPSKGSWQTVWALLDGNLNTGSFGPLADRLDPQKAGQLVNNPYRVSPLLTLPLFVGIGWWRTRRHQLSDSVEIQIAFAGLMWTLFFIWMPGWSPQWVYYLLPLIVLALPLRTAALVGTTLIFVNLLEWPMLLSRGLFWALPISILLRTFLLVILAIEFDAHLRTNSK
ncbi:MAG TPA: hypothetical protein PLC52_07080 [Anaerolineales bacterium]|nr:hypothetical protein [Anaerolineales bacterium]HRQ92613.1 hypothetical protein [Anaerolineales bacterium]